MNFTNFLSSQSTWNESFRYLEKTQWSSDLIIFGEADAAAAVVVRWMNEFEMLHNVVQRTRNFSLENLLTTRTCHRETFVFLFDDGTPGLDTHTQISSHQFRKTIFSHSQNKFLSFRVTYKYVVLTPDTVSQRIRRAERVDSLSRAKTEFSMQTKTMRCQ